MRGARHGGLAALAAAAAILGQMAIARAAPGDPDCDGPPAAAEPGTPAWDQREADNVSCGSQRSRDTAANPAYNAAATELQAEHGEPTPEDPFRDPARLAGTRFRYQPVSFPNASGEVLHGFLFRPCDHTCHDLPAGLARHGPPYPAVVVVHGGAASQEMYLWGTEVLAEQGYMVLTFQVPEPENAS